MTVAGLALRPFSGSGDYPAMVEIINAARSADGIESTETGRILHLLLRPSEQHRPETRRGHRRDRRDARWLWPGHVVEPVQGTAGLLLGVLHQAGVERSRDRRSHAGPQRVPPHRDRRRARPGTQGARVIRARDRPRWRGPAPSQRVRAVHIRRSDGAAQPGRYTRCPSAGRDSRSVR